LGSSDYLLLTRGGLQKQLLHLFWMRALLLKVSPQWFPFFFALAVCFTDKF
jgi:hypothetical protein